MGKLKNLDELKLICNEVKSKSKTIGLISGCFDILHPGHIDLFRFSKQQIDILIVFLENDETIRISKGSNRPIFPFLERAKVLSELESVDYILQINRAFDFNSSDAGNIHESIIQELKPNVIITDPYADEYSEEKKQRAEKFNIKFLPFKSKISSSSSYVLSKLENDF